MNASRMLLSIRPIFYYLERNYAVKTTTGAGAIVGLGKGKKKAAVGKMGAVVEKLVHPVETDPEKLINFVCGSNIYLKGEDIKIKPDSEYPDWLWKLNTGSPKKLEELDPESKEYWVRVRAMGRKRDNRLRSLRRF